MMRFSKWLLACALALSFTVSLAMVAALPAEIELRPPIAIKRTFAEKHPKLHKAGRKFRKICCATMPVVYWLGGVAQIINCARGW